MRDRYGAHPDASKHRMLAIKQVCNYVYNTAANSCCCCVCRSLLSTKRLLTPVYHLILVKLLTR